MTSPRTSTSPSWSFLDDGFAPTESRAQPASWESALALSAALSRWEASRREALIRDLDVAATDEALAALGGDPLRADWRGFRPLALAREEAWSDWLAFLLAGADTALLRDLFGDEIPGEGPRVEREVVVPVAVSDAGAGHYRSDLLVLWDDFGVHLEVKVGDSALDKTWNEARQVRATYGGTWRHFVLLLPSQIPDFGRVQHVMAGSTLVAPLSWENVAAAMRAAFSRPSIPGDWLGPARVFTGALEQLLLGRPFLGPRSNEDSVDPSGGDDG